MFDGPVRIKSWLSNTGSWVRTAASLSHAVAIWLLMQATVGGARADSRMPQSLPQFVSHCELIGVIAITGETRADCFPPEQGRRAYPFKWLAVWQKSPVVMDFDESRDYVLDLPGWRSLGRMSLIGLRISNANTTRAATGGRTPG